MIFTFYLNIFMIVYGIYIYIIYIIWYLHFIIIYLVYMVLIYHIISHSIMIYIQYMTYIIQYLHFIFIISDINIFMILYGIYIEDYTEYYYDLYLLIYWIVWIRCPYDVSVGINVKYLTTK